MAEQHLRRLAHKSKSRSVSDFVIMFSTVIKETHTGGISSTTFSPLSGLAIIFEKTPSA
jgi:hypothetical protein